MSWNIFKVKIPAGYSVGTPLWPLLKQIVQRALFDFSCGVCENLVQLQLQNYEGDKDVTYPLGVFATDYTYLGVANNANDYRNLWNGYAPNLQSGFITAGSGSIFEVKAKYTNKPFNLYALEFYSQQSHAVNAVLHVDTGDYVQYDNTIIDAGVTGVSTLSSTVNEYNGVWGISVNPTFTYRSVSTVTAIGTVIKVFHSRKSRFIGMNALTPYSYFGGVLPKAAISFAARGQFSMDWVANVTNWNQMNNLLWYAIMNLGGNPYAVRAATKFYPPPASVIGLRVIDITPFDVNLESYPWMTPAGLPNIRRLLFGANGANLVVPSINVFSHFPLVIEEIRITCNGFLPIGSAADSDTIINNLYASIASVIPEGAAFIRVENTSNRTAASDAAYNALDVLWTLQLN